MKHNTQHPQDSRSEGQLKSDYAEYVYAKAEIHENPLPFDDWLELEKEAYNDFLQPQESKEPLGITPGEWIADPKNNWCVINKEKGYPIFSVNNSIDRPYILTAVNSTYKKGYDPLQVDALYKAATIALSFMADLNGSNCFNEDSVWSNDMRQRAKHLQQNLFNTTKNAKL